MARKRCVGKIERIIVLSCTAEIPFSIASIVH